ncbi:DUF3095 family protein [Olivibacter sp. XZL3]
MVTEVLKTLSCYVSYHVDRHIYFVDGAGGGDTHASRMLKAKLHN